MRYRRVKTPGATFFFTVNLADRNSSLLTKHVEVLRHAVRHVKQRYPFRILAWVVLPDHMHAIWNMQDDDGDYSNRWRLIKQRFSKSIPSIEAASPSRQRKGEREIWQRRFWEHLIRNEKDLHRHVDYVHINPVKHGHVSRASDWPYSSIHRYIRAGILSPDWACQPEEMPQSGEPS